MVRPTAMHGVMQLQLICEPWWTSTFDSLASIISEANPILILCAFDVHVWYKIISKYYSWIFSYDSLSTRHLLSCVDLRSLLMRSATTLSLMGYALLRNHIPCCTCESLSAQILLLSSAVCFIRSATMSSASLDSYHESLFSLQIHAFVVILHYNIVWIWSYQKRLLFLYL
jgi:hypothetical protein